MMYLDSRVRNLKYFVSSFSVNKHYNSKLQCVECLKTDTKILTSVLNQMR